LRKPRRVAWIEAGSNAQASSELPPPNVQLSLFEPLKDDPSRPSAPAIRPDQEVAGDPIQRLHRRLGARVDVPLLRVVLTDNRQRIFSARKRSADGALELRIHRSFADADDQLLTELGRLLSDQLDPAGRRRVLDLVRRHHAAHSSPAPPRRLQLYSMGQTFDLGKIRDQINQAYFAGRLQVHITWGSRRQTRRRQRSLRLGSYRAENRLVRLHRCLDRPDVPRFVVESVVYHEMLHAAVPPRPGRSRRNVHSAEFRRRERLFSDHEAAQKWISDHFGTLVGGCL